MAAKSLYVRVFFLLWCVGLSFSQSAMCGVGCGGHCSTTVDCCMFLPEEQAVGTLVGNVDVSPLIYHGDAAPTITLQTGANVFDLNVVSGEVTTNIVIDRETQEHCMLFTVGVTQTETTPVTFGVSILDLNDHKPEFNQPSIFAEQAEADEQSPALMKICDSNLEATDRDSGMNRDIEYSLVGEDASLFEINEDNCLVSKGPIDRDSVTDPNSTPILVLRLTLIATDGGVPPMSSNVSVMINVTDLNDNVPDFRSESLNLEPVLENAEVGTLVHTIMAIDPDFNTVLTYTMDETTAPFQLSSSGELTVSGALNFEQNEYYDVFIKVSDGQHETDWTPLRIHIGNYNDKTVTVIFQACETIVENSMGCINLIKLNDDDDSTAQDYSVQLSGGASKYFSGTVGGVGAELIYVNISQIHPIDQETIFEEEGAISFTLNFALTEFGTPNIIHNLSIDFTVVGLNDNLPNLKEFRFSFIEGDPQRIGVLAGEDLDYGRNGTVVSYTISSASTPQGIDLTAEFVAANGGDPTLQILGNLDLSVAEKLNTTVELISPRIDREDDITSINITLTLTDGGGLSNTVSITADVIDINDNIPEFPTACCQYEFPENKPAGQVVGIVTATDMDEGTNAEIRYSLPQPSVPFTINEINGSITSLREFNREEQSEYLLIVRAQNVNASEYSETTITIRVSDVNDHPPSWSDNMRTSFTIPSDAAIGELVATMVAIDKDDGNNAKIYYQLIPEDNQLFRLGEGSGIITVKSVLTNQIGSHELIVRAFNPDGPSDHSVQLNITIVISTPSSEENSFPMIYGVVGGVAIVLLFTVLIIFVVVIWFYCRSRQSSINIHKANGGPYNNSVDGSLKRGILRSVPTLPNSSRVSSANGSGRGVKFDDTVHKIRYDDDRAVTNDAVSFTESSINLGSSGDESPQTPPRLHPSVHHNGKIPLEPHTHAHVPNGTSSLSPPEEDFYHTHPHAHTHTHAHPPHQRSPLMSNREYYLPPSNHITDYDGNSDDDSTLADDASNINAQMPSIRPSHNVMRYVSSPQHLTHLAPIQSSPPGHMMGGISPSHQYPLTHSPHHSLTLTPNDHTPHSPQSGSLDSLTGMSSHLPHENPRMMHQSSRGPLYPSHMPDAFVAPAPPPVRPRYEDIETTFMETAFLGSDYGDASTYASADLDEALHFRPDIEPGIFSLTATSSVYSDDNDESHL